jgi:hypothetical protein
MVANSKEFKVLKAVVSLDAIDVVDLLPPAESAPKMALHDEAMLKLVDAGTRDLDVPVVPDAPNRRATRVATHPASLGGCSVSHRIAARAWWTCSHST